MMLTSGSRDLTLPDFLIIGAPKSGTTSLYHYLKAHPEIFMPNLKEPHFFNFFGTSIHAHSNLAPWTIEKYASLFRCAEINQVIGESTPLYLYHYDKCIENIKKVYNQRYKDIKILVILRNPVERAWSYFMLMRRRGMDRDFFKALKDTLKKEGKDKNSLPTFIQHGMYHEQLNAYFKHFKNIKIILFEDFRENIQQVLKETYNFLSLQNGDFIPENIDIKYNVSGDPKNKLYKFIFNLWVRESATKDFLKNFIPYDTRQKLVSKITRKILQKEDIPQKVKVHLLNIYRPDIKKLMCFFDDSEKKTILNSWLQQLN